MLSSQGQPGVPPAPPQQLVMGQQVSGIIFNHAFWVGCIKASDSDIVVQQGAVGSSAIGGPVFVDVQNDCCGGDEWIYCYGCGTRIPLNPRVRDVYMVCQCSQVNQLNWWRKGENYYHI